jgi:hypothetical protein
MLSTGSSSSRPGLSPWLQSLPAISILSSSTSDLPVVTAQRALEGVRHAADDHQRVDLIQQIVDDVDLA